MPTNILKLPRLVVTHVEETDKGYLVTAHSAVSPLACPQCHGTSLVGFGRHEQLIKDVPRHGKPVTLQFDTRRFRCKHCGRTFLENHPDFHAERAMTLRLAAWIGAQSITHTFASVAEQTGLVEGTVRNIFQDHLTALETTVQFETPQWLGLSTLQLVKPRTVITNVQRHTVVGLLAGQDEDELARYLNGLADRNTIRYVTMNLWAPYRAVVHRVLPQALVSVDPSHFVTLANEAVERVRVSTRAGLTLAQKRGLVHDQSVLQTPAESLSDAERSELDRWAQQYPLLGAAYWLKESFRGIYRARSVQTGKAAYERWLQSVPPELRKHFGHFLTAVSVWQPEMLNHFRHPVAAPYTEALGRVQRTEGAVQRGYSFPALRAKILFTLATHSAKTEPCRTVGTSLSTLAEQLEQSAL